MYDTGSMSMWATDKQTDKDIEKEYIWERNANKIEQ